MRIAVATDDNVNVCGHVGKCRGFIIFDVEDGQIINKEIRENSFTNHFNRRHSDGEHHHSPDRGHGSADGHQRLAEGIKDCDYLVSHGMGRRLIEDIESLGIKTLVTVELDAETAAINLESGKLKQNDSGICG